LEPFHDLVLEPVEEKRTGTEDHLVAQLSTDAVGKACGERRAPDDGWSKNRQSLEARLVGGVAVWGVLAAGLWCVALQRGDEPRPSGRGRADVLL